MNSSLKTFRSVSATSLVPIFISLLLGYALHGRFLFQPQYPSFQIVAAAVTSSLFFLTLRVSRRDAFALFLVLVVLELGFLSRPPTVLWLLRDLVFKGALASSLYLFYTSFYLKTVDLRYLHPLVLATLMVLFNIAASILVIFMMRLDRSMEFSRLVSAIEFNAVCSLIVGLGTGAGVFLLDNGIVRKASEILASASKSLKDGFAQFGKNL